MRLLPTTLLGRTALTAALTLATFMLLSLGTAVYYIAIPMAKRSADDFAAAIVSAAHTMETLPPELQAGYRQQLLFDHGLIVADQTPALSEKSFDVPYYIFFKRSLARRAGQELSIVESVSGPIVWVDVPVGEKLVRMGFDRRRLGTNPPIVLIMALGGGALLVWLASLLETRRVGRPLVRLSAAVEDVGRGDEPPVLTEEGPEEIANLARAFNRMSSDIRELAENRTVIVAGISHDLRTPLTRLGIAVEMLDESTDPQLVADIRRDLTAMNDLIGEFLQFSKGLEGEPPVQLDLWELVEGQAQNLRRQGIEVDVSGCESPCPYVADPVALERLLANLMENAAHHGGKAPVQVDLRCDEREIEIGILDRGPGIPADQVDEVFRPFHRLETARDNKSGGSGLGLAIARQLANKYRWSIDLLPREGGGTVARVKLPIGQRP